MTEDDEPPVPGQTPINDFPLPRLRWRSGAGLEQLHRVIRYDAETLTWVASGEWRSVNCVPSDAPMVEVLP